VEVPNAYNQTFNVGADQPFTVNQLARAVSDAMGADLRIQYLPARLEVKHAYSSHEKVAEILAYRATTSLEEGIARMAEWVKLRGARQSQPFGALDIERQLPST
jgi:UDP-glucose 4-epimerase